MILVLSMLLSLFSAVDLSVFAAVTVWDGSVADGFAGGSGTEEDPYIIVTAVQLAYFAQSVNSGDRCYDTYIRMDSDIQLNDTTDWEHWGQTDENGSIISPVNVWTPIGDNQWFNCIFDGNGHIVSGVYINNEKNNQGLFGECNGTIKNVGVLDSYIHGSGYVGGVGGYGTTVTNCRNACTVISNGEYSHVGGIIAGNGTVENGYYLTDCVTDIDISKYGIALTETQMRQKESFAGFDFDAVWTIDGSAGNPYPTLIDVRHEAKIFTVTFTDDIGNVISEQEIEDGEAATAPDMFGYLRSEGDYVYTFDHWEGDYGSVKADITIKAVLRRTEVIRFLGTSVPVTVDGGVITAVGAGVATVTVISEDGGFRAECTITVEASLAAGDTNGDGVVNVKDLVRLMRYITDNSIEIFSADVNGDGKVDTKDLVRLMKIIAASK